ncbi:hypothetical protein HHK36_019048 [Tetracentron sinense]|uniref:Neutral ceramidase n=1 Tax=Tetracentron sinense TaxID=13715 RepID=A0A834Z1I4_TETSI|nr:hypothetical protein HHK36_019048 [Tetracentron sinense]
MEPEFFRMSPEVWHEPLREGQPRVEVFSVVFTKIHGSGHLYGTITFHGSVSPRFLYNRKREESESESESIIRPGDTALLTGPARSLFALDSFNIDVDIVDKDDYPSPDESFRRKQLSWNVYKPNKPYDVPLCADIDGKYCSVKVNYIVFTDAVAATVEVTLLIGKDTTRVFGQIAAGNANFSNESVLFQKSSNEHIEVGPAQVIPLSRSLVAVPLNSVLIIRADLWDYDTSDVIVESIARFHASPSGTFEKRIRGHGQKPGTTDGPGAFDFKQGDEKVNAFWRLVRDLLKTPNMEQIYCQHPKSILLDTEFMTMAGRHLRDAVKMVLTIGGYGEFNSNIHVVIARLTNTYAQYVTTFEEYQMLSC